MKIITAQKIKKIRLKLGESQAQFAERFGVDQSTIHRWETSGPPTSEFSQHGIRTLMGELLQP